MWRTMEPRAVNHAVLRLVAASISGDGLPGGQRPRRFEHDPAANLDGVVGEPFIEPTKKHDVNRRGHTVWGSRHSAVSANSVPPGRS